MTEKIKCRAKDCQNEFYKIELASHQKYCSDRCRSRTKKRELYEKRKKLGQCTQCGKEGGYCEDCKTYFSERYKKKTT